MTTQTREQACIRRTPHCDCEIRVKHTAWRTKVICAIGNFLAQLPTAHTLYAKHMESKDEQETMLCLPCEDEDIFGHGQRGMDDSDDEETGKAASCLGGGPDRCCAQGLRDAGELELLPGHTTTEPDHQHGWAWTGQSWQCKHCLRMQRQKGRCKQACKGTTPSMKAALTMGKQNRHRLSWAKDEADLFVCWCNQCGCYAGSKAEGLSNRCKGEATRQGKTVLSRVANHRHPDGSKRLQQAMPFN